MQSIQLRGSGREFVRGSHAIQVYRRRWWPCVERRLAIYSGVAFALTLFIVETLL